MKQVDGARGKARSITSRRSTLNPRRSPRNHAFKLRRSPRNHGRTSVACNRSRARPTLRSRKTTKRSVRQENAKLIPSSASRNLNSRTWLTTMPPYLLGYMDSVNRDFIVHQVLDDRKNKSTVAVVTRRKAGRNARRTVLKVFPKNDPGIINARKQEADFHRTASQGLHAHIAKYVAQFDYPEAFCLEMEHCDCGNLHSSAQGVPMLERLDLVRQVASALSHIHRKRMVHLDLKTENVALCRASNNRLIAKVIDFGAASYFDNGWRQGDPYGGTYMFAPPESFKGYDFSQQKTRGRFDLGPAIDMWGLGLIAIDLINNELPWNRAQMTDIRFRRFVQHMTKRPRGSRDPIPIEIRTRRLPPVYYEYLIPGLLDPFNPRNRMSADATDQILVKYLQGQRGSFRKVQGVVLFEAA